MFTVRPTGLVVHPGTDPVDPSQFAATVYHCLGVRPDTEIRDGLGRPYRLTENEPIAALLES